MAAVNDCPPTEVTGEVVITRVCGWTVRPDWGMAAEMVATELLSMMLLLTVVIPRWIESTCCLNMPSMWVLKSHWEQLYMYNMPVLTRLTGNGTVGKNGIRIVLVFEAILAEK